MNIPSWNQIGVPGSFSLSENLKNKLSIETLSIDFW